MKFPPCKFKNKIKTLANACYTKVWYSKYGLMSYPITPHPTIIELKMFMKYVHNLLSFPLL